MSDDFVQPDLPEPGPGARGRFGKEGDSRRFGSSSGRRSSVEPRLRTRAIWYFVFAGLLFCFAICAASWVIPSAYILLTGGMGGNHDVIINAQFTVGCGSLLLLPLSAWTVYILYSGVNLWRHRE